MRCYFAAPSADKPPNGGARCAGANSHKSNHCICRLSLPQMSAVWASLVAKLKRTRVRCEPTTTASELQTVSVLR
jgi:hypothetical protein